MSLGLAGTAPGLVLDLDATVVVVLPGPPRELQRLWPRALETEAVRRVLERAPARSTTCSASSARRSRPWPRRSQGGRRG